MRGYKKPVLFFTLITLLLFVSANFIFTRIETSRSASNYYKVEISRALNRNGGDIYDLSAFSTLTAVEVLDVTADKEETAHFFRISNASYTIVQKNGILYRFTYRNNSATENTRLLLNVVLGISAFVGYTLLIILYIMVVKPFNRIKSFPDELSRGKLANDLPEQKSKIFGRFIWGLNMLKATLDRQKAKELELQKEKQTMILSISHDIKTPLSAIKLYSKALSERLYEDSERIVESAKKIDEKANEIQRSVDAIIKTSTQDFIDFHVNNGEFYIKDLTDKISSYYKDKLTTLRTSFSIDTVANCLIKGDLDRMCEVAENFMENAIKYGDGKEITITFSTEEDCLLMNISNSGCTLPPDEIANIFDCFKRGSNSGNINGSGLGLYIARNLIARMGGEAFAQVSDGYFSVTAVMKKA